MTVAQPLFLPAGTASAAFTTAGGLVLSDAAGLALATYPPGLVYGALAFKKIVAGKLILDVIADHNN